jgi:hypothetical protein
MRRLGYEQPRPVRTTSLSEYRAHVLARLAEYEITVEWRPAHQMPSGAAAYAEVRKNRIVVPPIESETDVAVVLHEMGHCCAVPCRGPLHHRDPAERRWWKCLACETSAWAIAALLIRPLPWSKQMHARLMQSLDHYHCHTAGHAEAKRQLKRLACHLSFFELKQRALEQSLKPKPPTPTRSFHLIRRTP